ncbi:MAG: Uncharacterised protein [Cellulomonadaceae bacterium TMED98]|nr:MAG: Uncharacterised protein [Cellulomonadaceae bacterium TMED98]
MEVGRQQASFSATLSRIAQIRFVVEDVVNPVHQDVVGDQKEERPDKKHHVEALGRHVIGNGKGKGRVHPAKRPGAHDKSRQCPHDERLVPSLFTTTHTAGITTHPARVYAKSSIGATPIRTPEILLGS